MWLLRLFPQYRELEALAEMQAARTEQYDQQQNRVHELIVQNEALSEDVKQLQEANQQLSTDKLLLEDRLESITQDRAQLWETMQECLRGERYAYQTMVNHATQKTGAGTPYPDAHALPASEVRQIQKPGPIGRSSRSLPSEGAARANREFIRNYVETMGPTEAVG